MTHRLFITTLVASGVSLVHALVTRVLPPPTFPRLRNPSLPLP